MSEQLDQENPQAVLVSHLPPSGLVAARYLVQRLHARDANRPIIVGRWADGGDTDKTADRLTTAGSVGRGVLPDRGPRRIHDLAKPKTAEKPDLSPALAA